MAMFWNCIGIVYPAGLIMENLDAGGCIGIVKGLYRDCIGIYRDCMGIV